MKSFFALIILVLSVNSRAEELLANCAHFADAPKWLTLNRVNRVAEPIENFMEWSTRRVEVIWYHDQSSFSAAHTLGPAAMAVTFPGKNKVLLGPLVTEKNFDQVFGHELVHVISGQKYTQAIPAWLEEGIANYLSKSGTVDYALLAKQGFKDVHELSHPMTGNAQMIHVRYQASQALAEMLASKCDLRNLLRLSVQRKMEDELENICRIPDINAAYKKWISEKSGHSSPSAGKT